MRPPLLPLTVATALLLVPGASSNAQPLTVDGPAVAGNFYPSAAGDTFTCNLQTGRRYRVMLHPPNWNQFDIAVTGPGGEPPTRFVGDFLGEPEYDLETAFSLVPQFGGVHTIQVRPRTPHGWYFEREMRTWLSVMDAGPASDDVPNGISSTSRIAADGQVVARALDYGGDRDAFLLDVNPASLYRLRISTADSNLPIRATLTTDRFPVDRPLIANRGYNQGDDQTLIFRTRAEPRTWALKVTSCCALPYQVSLQPLEPDMPVAASNTPATAVGVPQGEPFPLVVADTDDAGFYFRVHLDAATGYNLVPMAGYGDYDGQLAMLSSDGVRFLAIADQGSKGLAQPFVPPLTGDYLFRVKLWQGAARFQVVSRGPSPLIPLASPAMATPLEPGGQFTSRTSVLPPMTYFEVMMAPGGVYAFEVATDRLCTGTGIPMSWYAADTLSGNQSITFSDLNSSAANQPLARSVVLANPMDRPQSVILNVYRANLGTCSLNTALSVRYTQLTTADRAHGYSPEDPLAVPTDGSLQWLLSAYPASQGPRWLTLAVAAGHRYTIRTVTPVQNVQAQLLSVIDSAGNPVADRYDSVTFVASSTGQVLVRMDDAPERAEPTQRFIRAIAATDDGPSTDDFPDTSSDAATLIPGEWTSGVLETQSDSDIFAIDLRPGTRAAVTLEYGPPNRPVVFTVSPEGGPSLLDGWSNNSHAYLDQAGTASAHMQSALGGRYTVTVTRSQSYYGPRLPVDPTPVPYRLRIDADGCLADIASAGGEPRPDGQLTADDLIVFISGYMSSDPVADIACVGGATVPDGYFTPDDLVTFITFFFDCPRP